VGGTGATEESARLDRCVGEVTEQCKLLVASSAFLEWSAKENAKEGEFVAVNNSFLFREGRQTTKNDQYVAFELGATGDIASVPVVVKPGRINVQFKKLRVNKFDEESLFDLRQSVESELENLGVIVFSLVGQIGEIEAAEVELVGIDKVSKLRFEPHASKIAELSEDVIVLSSVGEIDEVWAAVEVIANDEELDTEKLSTVFEKSFHELQENAACPIDPSDVTEEADSILSQLSVRVGNQVKAFSDYLSQHRSKPNDEDIYNELLRVAYNFADGARLFLNLLVGICDLKPILFWLTANEQVALAHQFASLPFSLVGSQKPSLDRYRGVIAGARNQAFHDIFAFQHPFRVSLPGDALKEPELSLFRSYNRKSEPALTFEDRQLVEILETLTRTPSQKVPNEFWEGNELVMNAVVDLVDSFRRSLVTVRP
jgi:hypothetical protein